MRQFETGATRDGEDGKLDYEGFLSPAVLEAFAEYMHKHRVTPDGVRGSDNWQQGIPKDAYMKSMFRHFMDVWMYHRAVDTELDQLEALMALLFNVQGYAYELLRENQGPRLIDPLRPVREALESFKARESLNAAYNPMRRDAAL